MTKLTPRLTPQWRCNECLKIHELEADAEECCPTSVSKVYLCPNCELDYLNETDALLCCEPAMVTIK